MTIRDKVKRLSPLWLGVGISGSLLFIMFLIEAVSGGWSELLIGGEFDPLEPDNLVSGGCVAPHPWSGNNDMGVVAGLRDYHCFPAYVAYCKDPVQG